MSAEQKTYLFKYLAEDLSFRASLVDATLAVREMQSLQNTYPIATNAVGRAMVASVLMASNLKEQQMVSVYFRGDGPLEMFFAEANYEGDVRGYTPHPQFIFADDPQSLNLGRAIGQGLLNVVRSVPHQKGPQRGSVAIQTGEVGDDLAHYLLQSHQTPSLVSVGVKVNAYGMVQSAGGILIELLPDADKSVIQKLEDNLKMVPSLSEALATQVPLEELERKYFANIAVAKMPYHGRVAYSCRCSKERFKNALKLLGVSELKDMLRKAEMPQAKCELCGRQYSLSQDELSALISVSH